MRKFRVLLVTQRTNIARLFLPLAEEASRRPEIYDVQALDVDDTLGQDKTLSSMHAEIFKSKGINVISLPPDIVDQRLPYHLKCYKAISLFFNQIYKPDVIVVGYEWGVEGHVVNVAKEKKILTVHLQHGLWGTGKFSSFYNHKKINEKSALEEQKLVRKTSKVVSESLVSSVMSRISKVMGNYIANEPKDNEDTLSFSDQELLKLITPKHAHYSINSDLFLVTSEWYRNQTISEIEGFQESRVHRIGYLRFDAHSKSSWSRDSLAQRWNLNTRDKWGVYLYTPFHKIHNFAPHVKEDVDQAVLDAYLNSDYHCPKVQFIVVAHPNWAHQTVKLIEFLEKRLGASLVKDRFRFIDIGSDHFALYESAEIIWGVKSGTLTEAAVSSGPIFRQCYVLDEVWDPIQIDTFGVIPIFDKSNISLVVKNYVTDDSMARLHEHGKERLINHSFGNMDGRAAERAVDIILDRLSN